MKKKHRMKVISIESIRAIDRPEIWRSESDYHIMRQLMIKLYERVRFSTTEKRKIDRLLLREYRPAINQLGVSEKPVYPGKKSWNKRC